MIKLTKWRNCKHEEKHHVYIDRLAIDAIDRRQRSIKGGGEKLCTWIQVGNSHYDVEEDDETILEMLKEAA